MSKFLYVSAVLSACYGITTNDLGSMYTSVIVSALAVFMEGFENGSS